MNVFRFLIPVMNDSYGQPHPDWLWLKFEGHLIKLAGGFTYGGLVNGTWKDENGKIIRDTSRSYEVALAPIDEEKLVELLQTAAAAFGQQCIYLASIGTAEFVYPLGG